VKSAEVACSLSYSILMLNTDLFNTIRSENRISMDNFISASVGANDETFAGANAGCST